jgi:cytochrome d ubiquinol oxidase subunit II
MLVALVGGSVILLPALVYLYVLFQRSAADRPSPTPATPVGG